MSAANPIAVSEEEPFVIGKSDLAYFFNNPCRCDCALVLLCTSGHAQVTVDLRRGPLQLNMIVLLLPGSVLMFDDASADFSVRFGAFSPDLFGEAGFRLGLSFFSFLKENPISQVNERMAAGLSTWFEIMDYTYQDRGNMFRKTIVRNRLQNIMLEHYDKICPITKEEHNILMVMLEFPEKFWKVVNQYYNGNKSWIPDKNIEKLNTVYTQQQKKEAFINKLWDM